MRSPYPLSTLPSSSGVPPDPLLTLGPLVSLQDMQRANADLARQLRGATQEARVAKERLAHAHLTNLSLLGDLEAAGVDPSSTDARPPSTPRSSPAPGPARTPVDPPRVADDESPLDPSGLARGSVLGSAFPASPDVSPIPGVPVDRQLAVAVREVDRLRRANAGLRLELGIGGGAPGVTGHLGDVDREEAGEREGEDVSEAGSAVSAASAEGSVRPGGILRAVGMGLRWVRGREGGGERESAAGGMEPNEAGGGFGGERRRDGHEERQQLRALAGHEAARAARLEERLREALSECVSLQAARDRALADNADLRERLGEAGRGEGEAGARGEERRGRGGWEGAEGDAAAALDREASVVRERARAYEMERAVKRAEEEARWERERGESLAKEVEEERERARALRDRLHEAEERLGEAREALGR